MVSARRQRPKPRRPYHPGRGWATKPSFPRRVCGSPPLPPLYHRRVEPKRDDLTAAWVWTQARLPEGWSLDSLRCASIGLQAEQRSDDWIAVAIGPDGVERTHRGADAFDALAGLANPSNGGLPARPHRGSFDRDPFRAKLPVRTVPRQSASGRLDLPRVTPSVRRFERHPGAGQGVADRVAAGLEDALAGGSAGHGASLRRDRDSYRGGVTLRL